jgi:hypothetical protein
LIESRTAKRFWRLFRDLPPDVREEAKHAYELFRANPLHPSLRFKKLEGEDDLYSVRIGLGYRALAVVRNGRAIWFWIGNHQDYDRLT